MAIGMISGMLNKIDSLSESQYKIAAQSIDKDNCYEYSNPKTLRVVGVTQVVQYSSTLNHTLISQRRIEHTMTLRITVKVTVGEFVEHHTLEHISLVVDPVEGVVPEFVQNVGRNQETTHRHP